jgi:hypothetical protein
MPQAEKGVRGKGREPLPFPFGIPTEGEGRRPDRNHCWKRRSTDSKRSSASSNWRPASRI